MNNKELGQKLGQELAKLTGQPITGISVEAIKDVSNGLEISGTFISQGQSHRYRVTATNTSITIEEATPVK